ncbi:MAG: hypothetical protein [Cressdnaviricota sp.]|nr:MAG: hypothetical protein [Cressdnaviricota sp.]
MVLLGHDDVSHEIVEGFEHAHAGLVLARDDLSPAAVRDLVRTDLVDSVVEFFLKLVRASCLDEPRFHVLSLLLFLFFESFREMLGFLLVMHHHLEEHHVAGVGRRSIGDVADGRHLGGYTCGVRGGLESEEGYALRPYPVHFPSTPSPST